ncbi:hypothetical protein GLV89_14610 [Halomonas alkaliantarctica]|nr:hypothetical protein [Halomonas alkaliantarctica]
MNTAFHIPAPSVLTQAHRDAMAYIQDLAITISQQDVYAIEVDYSGHVNQFMVSIMRFSELKNENFKADKIFRIDLPGDPRRSLLVGHDALEELQAVARELEKLLVIAEGGAA